MNGLDSDAATGSSGKLLNLWFAGAAPWHQADLFQIKPETIGRIIRRGRWLVIQASPTLRYSPAPQQPWTFGFHLRSSQDAQRLENRILRQAPTSLHCAAPIQAMFATHSDALHTIGLPNHHLEQWVARHSRALILLSPRSNPHRVFHVDEHLSQQFPTPCPARAKSAPHP